MSHGLKSLARELPKHGRFGDSIVAHINPQEAALLKSLGGSGTINPTTGLPEFFSLSSITKPIQHAVGQANPFNPGSAAGKVTAAIPGVSQLQNAATQVFQPLEKAVVQPASAGLAQFDKAVGKVIPGGWGTVGMVAASMIPGMQPLAMAGLGAINGSGVLRKGGSFNLQGAMMGGAMAYGMSSLAQYAQGAVPTGIEGGAEASFNALPEASGDAISSLNSSQGWTGAGAQTPSSIPSGAIDAANLAQSGSSIGANGINAATGEIGSGLAGNASTIVPQPSVGSQIMSGNFGDALSQAGTNISEGISSIGNKAVNAYDTLTTPETYTDFAKAYGDNVAKTGEGIKNLTGFGDVSASAASKATAASTGINPTMATAGTIYGGMGLAALEEQRNQLDQQKAANAISQSEYNNAVAEIDKSIATARSAVAEHPFSTNPSRDVSIGDTYYDRTGGDENLYSRNTSSDARLYNMGGSVDGEYGMDEARGLNQGNLQNGLFSKSMPSYAAGGQIDMGNGYNPFANLSGMGGGLGAIRQDMTTFDPNFNKPNFDAIRNSINGTNSTTQQDMMGGLQNSYPTATNANSGLQSMSPQPAFGNAPITPFGSGSLGSAGGGALGSVGGGNSNAFPLQGQYGIVKMAQGGVARFLSGGGDGMSDDIPARIDGKQEARLADGEFVIPADVVSHLGNGSSKAGAKQLYSMMDKVRTARTGNKKQGKQINPRKYLAA